MGWGFGRGAGDKVPCSIKYMSFLRILYKPCLYKGIIMNLLIFAILWLGISIYVTYLHYKANREAYSPTEWTGDFLLMIGGFWAVAILRRLIYGDW